MENKTVGQQYRVTVSPLTFKRLRQLALVHGVSETALVNQLIARQFKYDKEKERIRGFVEHLDDSDTDNEGEEP